ncbi:uncharacterized protein isoform X3 [Leptinotarsa decemlineata]
MQEHLPIFHRKKFLAIFGVICLLLTLFYYDNSLLGSTEQITFFKGVNNASNFNNITTTTSTTLHFKFIDVTTAPTLENKSQQESNFIVSSSMCKILDMEPFNKDAKKFFQLQKYKPCRSKKLMTYVTKTDNIATLHIDKEVVPSYTKKEVSCCYSNITRKYNVTDPDGGISISPCQVFENNVTIYNDPVLVKCSEMDTPAHAVYENVHVAVIIKEEVKEKIENFDNTTKPFSVLFIGIDSISRLNFIRTLPNTYKFIEENNWLSLKGYNKIDDNTFPNLMAILTGYNQSHAYSVCDPNVIGKLDNCSIIWYDFKRLGFITAYAEDEGSINTFNYKKKGFKLVPSDYYFRPYVLATEKLKIQNKDGIIYCTGPESAGERIMNIAKEFSITFKNYPYFGFFWMNSFSHNEINSPTGMDDKVKQLLEDVTRAGVTENSIIFFLSDHGMRFGDITLTTTGWLEQRLPFIYVSFPKWFQQNFPKEFEVFRSNSRKLTSPYDLHMTLKHILVLSGHNFTSTPSQACPKCRSLFEKVEPERSCEDAGIAQHWCTCAGYISTTLDEKLEKSITNYVLEEIHAIIQYKNGAHKCAEYSVDKILSIQISQPIYHKKESFLLITIKTNPKAIFETTIGYYGDLKDLNLSISGDISRLDSYNEHSKCVENAYLKKYCYCRPGRIRA